MNRKYTDKNFSPEGQGAEPEAPHSGNSGQDGHDIFGGLSGTRARNREVHAAHEAYTAHDGELPPFVPGATGGSPLGELFPEGLSLEPEGAHGQDTGVGHSLAVSAMSDEELLAVCKPRLCGSCPVQKEADDSRLRALAEVDNARKRMAREKEEYVRYAGEAVLADILPSLDNLDLALQHATQEDVCKNFVVGVEMTKKLLLDALKKHGLERAGTVGEPFDPALHEAVGMTDDENVPDGHVCALLSCGYRLHSRLLRPARVVVCKKT